MIFPFVITLKDHPVSEAGAERLIQSSFKVGNKFNISKFEAVTADSVDKVIQQHKLTWNYPWEGEVVDFASGLKKSAYQTTDPRARMACFMSHYLLWKMAMSRKMTILVLEHDAVFNNRFNLDENDLQYDITGINNPLGATRRSQQFYDAIIQRKVEQQRVPVIDEPTVPQGLAGNSAYVIKPAGGETMLRLTKEYGMWPNDALMCRQLVRSLGVTRTFYTHVDRMQSTTT